jgi:hypothetical protein
MIRNTKKLRQFEKEYFIKNKININQNFLTVEALLAEAIELNIFPLKNPLDGIEIDIKIAKVVNSVSKTP